MYRRINHQHGTTLVAQDVSRPCTRDVIRWLSERISRSNENVRMEGGIPRLVVGEIVEAGAAQAARLAVARRQLLLVGHLPSALDDAAAQLQNAQRLHNSIALKFKKS